MPGIHSWVYMVGIHSWVHLGTRYGVPRCCCGTRECSLAALTREVAEVNVSHVSLTVNHPFHCWASLSHPFHCWARRGGSLPPSVGGEGGMLRRVILLPPPVSLLVGVESHPIFHLFVRSWAPGRGEEHLPTFTRFTVRHEKR